jgi:hypothetical protein
MLTLCLLGSLTTFSQKDYPKTIELNGDTVTIFTFLQAKWLAKEIVQKEYLVVRSRIDSIDLDIMSKLVSKFNILEEKQSILIAEYKTIMSNQKEMLTIQEDIIKGYAKKDKLRKWRNAGIITGVTGGLVTALFLVK